MEEELRSLVDKRGLYLEEIQIISAGKHSKLIVVIDRPSGPGGVDIDQLSMLTKDVSQWCDDHQPFRGTYDLEVTTPGIERPLSTHRHFTRALHHYVHLRVCTPQMTKETCEVVEGLLVRVEDSCIYVDTSRYPHLQRKNSRIKNQVCQKKTDRPSHSFLTCIDIDKIEGGRMVADF